MMIHNDAIFHTLTLIYTLDGQHPQNSFNYDLWCGEKWAGGLYVWNAYWEVWSLRLIHLWLSLAEGC